ncbi:MAG: class I SAM-dependent methyltransferase [Candidatus Kapaibacterium sp.]
MPDNLSIPNFAPKIMIWIGYTTIYREGGKQFARAAQTMAREKEESGRVVLCEAVESKGEFLEAMRRIEESGERIDELHFIGHSGVFGIMFGSRQWPEQFSPHEWRTASIPFAPNANAFFHACRTSRWFTRFFAETFQVRTHGYYWYTCFSRSPSRFLPDHSSQSSAPLYVISIKGKKSHGLIGSALKYSGIAKPEPMVAFDPEATVPDRSYDAVSRLYDKTFADITVREDEWSWLGKHLPTKQPLRALDIGCGNGALLAELSSKLTLGVGVDASKEMVERARERFKDQKQLQFAQVTEPRLPFDDQSFDVVLSFMSFRYLDWDPIMAEIRRVLAPGGKILIVDMAASPFRLRESFAFIRSKIRHARGRRKHPEFAQNLEALVSHPDWKEMVRYNPARAEHEYRWYLASRFPEGTIETLNIGWTHRLLAFDSGPLQPGETAPLSYP